MIFETLPANYAQALFDLTEKDFEAIEREFGDLVRLLDSDAKVKSFFSSPLIRPDAKLQVIEKSIRGKASDIVVNFLCVMARRNRISEIANVYEVYRYLVNLKLGRKSITVDTAVLVDDSMRSRIEKTLERYFKSGVDVQYHVNPELLGGIVIRHDGHEIDVSILRQIRRIKQQLVAKKIVGEKYYEN